MERSGTGLSLVVLWVIPAATTFANDCHLAKMKPKTMFSILAAGAVSTVVVANVLGIGKPSPIPVIPYETFNLPQASQTNLPPEVEPALAPKGNSYIRVFKTDKTVESTKDPIWKVELVVDGKVVDSVDSLIGRSYRQTANRHTAGNKSPLPVGTYSIDRQGIVREAFSDPELGKGYWIPITPLFATGRSALGIHQDPSWGKTNGESGTSGCIGLSSPEDTVKVVGWIRQHNISSMVVQS